jgi:hypothetical protein
MGLETVVLFHFPDVQVTAGAEGQGGVVKDHIVSPFLQDRGGSEAIQEELRRCIYMDFLYQQGVIAFEQYASARHFCCADEAAWTSNTCLLQSSVRGFYYACQAPVPVRESVALVSEVDQYLFGLSGLPCQDCQICS